MEPSRRIKTFELLLGCKHLQDGPSRMRLVFPWLLQPGACNSGETLAASP